MRAPPQKQTNKGRDAGTTKGPPQLYLDAVAGLKLPGRERRKGRLCNVSAKSQSQTHLHLRRLPVGFEFFRVASPGASRSTNAQHSTAQQSTALHSLCHLSITPCAKGLFNDSDQRLSGHLGGTLAHTHTHTRPVGGA